MQRSPIGGSDGECWGYRRRTYAKKVENKLTNKGKYTHVSLMRQLYFPLFVIRKKWSLIVDEAARQVGEGFDAAIA